VDITITHFPFIADEFKGKRALVTGGTQGIVGEAIVNRLNKGGAKVVTTARSIPSQMRSSDAIFIQADIKARRKAASRLSRRRYLALEESISW
jgi:NAD(P)-dependent dehydrogenase (short-subunit alcohol dehydrogenase family)